MLRAGAGAARAKLDTFPLDRVQARVSTFLGEDRALNGSHIVLTYYCKPIACQLARGALLAHPDYLTEPRDTLCLCVHESLHGFPGSSEALVEQAHLRDDPEFDREYLEMTSRWLSGPEEFLVTGAEAYLTRELGLRSHEECVRYLKTQNGGMPLALAIYECLLAVDSSSPWPGFGRWVADELRSGRVRGLLRG